jgi:hypothetical protein
MGSDDLSRQIQWLVLSRTILRGTRGNIVPVERREHGGSRVGGARGRGAPGAGPGWGRRGGVAPDPQSAPLI